MASLPYVTLQPSQAPGIIGDIGDSLVQAAQRSMQQKQQAIDNLLKQKQMEAQDAQMRAQEARAQAEAARQEHYAIAEQHKYEHQLKQEAAGALKPMNEMFASGDTAGAMALGKIHGFDLRQTNLGGADPGAAPQAPQPGMAGPIPSPEDRDYAASQPGDMNQPDQTGAGMVEASNQAQTQDQQMQAGRDQYAQALADHPRLVAEHAGRLAKFEEAKKNPIFSGQGPFGAVEFNPGAVRQQKEQQLAQTAQTMQQGLPPKYGLLLASKIKGNVPPAEASRQVEQMMRTDEDRDIKQQHEDQQLTRDQRFMAALALGNARKTTAESGKASKEDAAAARAQAMLDRALTHSEKVVDWKGLVGMDNTMRGLMANIDSPNVLQKRDAQIQLGRLFRGTTPTEGEMHLLYNNLGGTADKWNQFVAGLETGGLSDEQSRQLKASAGVAHQELEHRKERAFGSLATQFGPGSGFEALAPQINTALKARGQAVGVDVPDIYEPTGSKGAQVLGSRLKAKGAEQPVATNALARAAKIKSLPPQDQEAVKWAEANKGDPRAMAIMEKNGL